MAYNPDSEDRLEGEAMLVLRNLGYDTVDAFKETFGENGTLGRDNRQEFVLKRHLREALVRLNPDLPSTAYTAAIDILTENRSIKGSVEAANQEIYDLLKDGVTVDFHDSELGEDCRETLKVIDWNEAANNHFLAVQQLWGETSLYTKRPDIVLFVNGIPLVVIELKAVHKQLRHAYAANVRDYKDTLPELMWYNGFIILSNGSEAKVGSISSGWEHYKDWKRINSEGEEGRAGIESVILGTCERDNLLDLVENFSVFSTLQGSTSKIVARNHQFLGVNNAITAIQDRETREGRLGVFWHTQGSGKSYSMVFLAQKVFRKLTGNWTFVIVTDRNELDDQIYKTFASCGAVKQDEDEIRADSGENLKALLRNADHRYIFTLIHKFHSRDGKVFPVLSERSDIIVITDEAHRTQYGTLATNMRHALPNASFIAFTGTPLISGEEQRTREIFGDYVSVYDFKRSIEDEATVPLFYENRIPEVEVVNQQLDDDIYQKLDEAQLDEDLERELERQFSREYAVITRDDRLERIAEDIVKHYMLRGYAQERNSSKAMVVCIDRFTAVRMYQKVKARWEQAQIELRRQQGGASEVKREDLKAQIQFMRETEMAVVISSAQNEVDEFRKRGLDIQTHRRLLVEDDLDVRFKDPDDKLQIVFVCAMWMTGFDVPSCATIYLDKPMRNHTLMQTIARANRVFREKRNGLIVDYIGIFRDLEKALSIYGASGDTGDGSKPVRPSMEQVAELREWVTKALDFCQSIGIDIGAILAVSSYMDRLRLIGETTEKILRDGETREQFVSMVDEINKRVDDILSHPEAAEFIPVRQLLTTILRRLQDNQTVFAEDIEDVAEQIGDVLDDSVLTVNWAIRSTPLETLYDLSKIDFDALKRRFELGEKRTTVEKLRGAVKRQLEKLVEQNQTRMSYLETFNSLVARYNTGATGVDEIFSRMLAMVDAITEEEQRHIKEGLTEEELAVFDLLTRPKKTLSENERAAVKSTVKALLHKLKTEKLKLDWRKSDIDRSAVKEAIGEELDACWSEMGLPDAEFEEKAENVYQHIAYAYTGGGRSIYDQTA